MTDWKRQLIKTGLDALYFTGSHRLLSGLCGGRGLVLTLHRVRPPVAAAFQPNRLLEISPEFLTAVIRHLREYEIDFVSLDEVHRRLVERDFERRFVAFTFDDGYRDFTDYALPIFRRYEVPFTVFAVTEFAEGRADMWWVTLEEVVRKAKTVAVEMAGSLRTFSCADVAEKREAYCTIYWWLRSLDEPTLRRVIRDLAARHGVDAALVGSRLCMSWSELAALARDPLCTIGGHSLTHARLRGLPEGEARTEIARSLDIIGERLGKRPAHFAYPVGDVTSAGCREFRIAGELDLKTAFTTRPGVLFAEHREHLTALPRVSLNGEYQALRHIAVLLSGVPFLLWNGFRRLDVA